MFWDHWLRRSEVRERRQRTSCLLPVPGPPEDLRATASRGSTAQTPYELEGTGTYPFRRGPRMHRPRRYGYFSSQGPTTK